MNNLIVFKQTRPKLNKKQMVLYNMLVTALKNNESITNEKIIKTYRENFNCTYWESMHERRGDAWIGARLPMADWRISNSASQWIRYSLGALICKGYCHVLPRFDISEIDNQSINAIGNLG